jgi:predicted DNA-binding transcriptional regulator AlpA
VKRDSPASTSTPNRPPIRFLRPQQVESAYGLTRKFLAHSRTRGDGPPFVKPSTKLVLYSVEELERWLAERRQRSTSDCRVATE